MMQRGYRPEIDGLRALAVIPVALFHAHIPGFAGGYIGVDVFFAISGFLITSIILEEKSKRRFSLASFYERRARRILPALFLVLFACLPFAWWWMTPDELDSFGQSLAAVPLFVSNILFWRTSGYFGGIAELKPLLHTWSLSIEEQYYLFFPLALGVLLIGGVKRAGTALGIVAGLSFALAAYLTAREPSMNFFLLPSRAWELLAGSLLALFAFDRRPMRMPGPAIRSAAGLIGLVMILVPVFLYDETTAFPGLAALPPILGTLLILAFADQRTWAGAVLASRPFVGVGLISYSFYLWHQPVLAFARLMAPGALPTNTSLALLMLSMACAAGSWAVIERPFRDRRNFSRSSIFLMSAAGSAAFVGCGLFLALGKGVPTRFAQQNLPLVAPIDNVIKGCPPLGDGTHQCRIGAPGAKPSVALVGDSHSYAIATTLDAALKRQGLGGIVLHTSCHPIPGIFDSREPMAVQDRRRCEAANRAMLARLSKPSIKHVVVAIRWTLRLYPMDGAIDHPWFDNGEGGVEADTPYRRNVTAGPDGMPTDSAAAKSEAVQAFLSRIGARKHVILVYPVPEVGWTPDRLNMLALRKNGSPPAVISTDWPRFQERNRAATSVLDAVKAPLLDRVYPAAIFCNTRLAGRCVVQEGSTLYYHDDDHLSATGARLLVNRIMLKIAPSNAHAL